MCERDLLDLARLFCLFFWSVMDCIPPPNWVLHFSASNTFSDLFYLQFCRKVCRWERMMVELFGWWGTQFLYLGSHIMDEVMLPKEMQNMGLETFALIFHFHSFPRCSQRKPQRISLLFEDDAVTGESLFSSQSTLPSAFSVVSSLSFKNNAEYLYSVHISYPSC